VKKRKIKRIRIKFDRKRPMKDGIVKQSIFKNISNKQIAIKIIETKFER
jgi:hypothetical protein